ncbi:hypothetical protein SVIOM74S_08694 [Streptomyces violarus]
MVRRRGVGRTALLTRCGRGLTLTYRTRPPCADWRASRCLRWASRAAPHLHPGPRSSPRARLDPGVASASAMLPVPNTPILITWSLSVPAPTVYPNARRPFGHHLVRDDRRLPRRLPRPPRLRPALQHLERRGALGTAQRTPAPGSNYRERIGGISSKVLTETLRRLQFNGLVDRQADPDALFSGRVPNFTALGRTLLAPIDAVGAWAFESGDEVMAARSSMHSRTARSPQPTGGLDG